MKKRKKKEATFLLSKKSTKNWNKNLRISEKKWATKSCKNCPFKGNALS